MKVLYQIPSLDTIYAGRTIYYGYKHAFEDMGHTFLPFTVGDDPKFAFNRFKPDIFIGGIGTLSFKNIDLDLIKTHKKRGMKVFVNTPFWNSPLSKLRVNESPSLSKNKKTMELIKSGLYGDIYFNVCEEGDERMDGFEETTGYKHTTLALAADKTIIFPEYCNKFKSDIAYIGTNLPDKRNTVIEYILPLRKMYALQLYGQDWTLLDQMIGIIQKGGQYFNIPILRSLRKPKLQLDDERRIYTSSTISINIHEEYQRKFGGDCNERTFKIPLAGGFEITDDVACIRKYFKEGKEIIIAKNKDDWFDKIKYFYNRPEKRISIITAGRKRVLKDHTYHNRVTKIIKLYYSIS